MKTVLAGLMVCLVALTGVANADLIGQWDFEGEPKTLANYGDRSGNGYDMTNNPGTGFIIGGAAFGDYCARNRADKKSPGVPCANAPKISALESALTITGWFKGNEDQGRDPDKLEVGAHLGLARNDGGKPTLGFGRRLSDGLFTARLSTGCNWSGNPTGYESFDVSLGRELGQSDWVFCALRFDNGAVKVYTGAQGDAGLVTASGTLSQTELYNPVTALFEPTAVDPRQFGPFSVSGFGFGYTSAENKAADDVYIFDTALTDAEIEAIFPEPATMLLLVFGGVGVLARRRRP